MSLSTLHTEQLRAVIEANRAYEETRIKALNRARHICNNVLSEMYEAGALDDREWEEAFVSPAMKVSMSEVKAKIVGRDDCCIEFEFEVILLDLDIDKAAKIVAERLIALRR